MERKLKPLIVQDKLKAGRIHIFSPEEFRRVFSVTTRAAQEFIKDHSGDLFLKLRNGLYALKCELPSELEIANRLYQPSYISFEYALSHYGIIPESVYTVTSATTKITRQFVTADKAYEYSRIKKEAYTGYELITIGNAKILMATQEKALTDYLYFVDLKLKTLNDRFVLKKIKKPSVLKYAGLFGRKSLVGLCREVVG
jgi:predicted transcriptional regulator of viral defense system